MSVKNIYLDYSASTPVDSRVVEKMLPYFTEHFANPSSQHRAGWQAQRAIDQARSQVAKLLNARLTKEIIFTSGASEANTLAIVGFIQNLRKQDPQRKLHAITSKVEHKSVLETFAQIAEFPNVEIEVLPPNRYGQVDIEALKKALRPETVLMSFMWANNEVGSVNPIKEITDIAKANNICFHSDATQVCGKMPINLQDDGVDLLSLSGHKMYGPKGVGALYVRHEGHHPAVNLWPIVRGGSQEYQLRAGTLNVPGIVGLGEAAVIALENLTNDEYQLQKMAEAFKNNLLKLCPSMTLNGHPEQRIPGHLHLSFPEIRWDLWLPRLSQLCVSTTSACTSESSQGSHVLEAMGFDLAQMHSSLRISLGKLTTEAELSEALTLFQRVFNER
ncbi:MAG: hypothetical protein RJB66_1375 [Pseudomonadota bacterium]|jgi:cysteine desulfurase